MSAAPLFPGSNPFTSRFRSKGLNRRARRGNRTTLDEVNLCVRWGIYQLPVPAIVRAALSYPQEYMEAFMRLIRDTIAEYIRVRGPQFGPHHVLAESSIRNAHPRLYTSVRNAFLALPFHNRATIRQTQPEFIRMFEIE